jgi:hypothetical protein
MSDQPPDFSQAVALFKAFQLREPRRGEIVQLGGLERPVTALEVGAVVGLAYKALRDGKRYFHEFDAPRARLFVSADGKQIFFEGGVYKFSPRGFLK